MSQLAFAFVAYTVHSAGSAKAAVSVITVNYLQLLGNLQLSQLNLSPVVSGLNVFQLNFFSNAHSSR